MTVRVDNPAPVTYDLGQLRTLAQTRFGAAFLDLNEVRSGDGSTLIAVYLPASPNAATATGWVNDLTAYTVSHPSAADLQANLATLQANAQTALTTNAAFLGTVAARRTAIASGKSTAQTGTTATVTSVAQAQTQIRSVWSTLVQIATALDDLNNDAESVTKQNNAVIRLLLNAVDTTTGT